MVWTKTTTAGQAGPARPITPVGSTSNSSGTKEQTRRSPQKNGESAAAAGSTTGTAGQSSASAYRGGAQDSARGHLRQRSVQTPRGELSDDPFTDRAAPATRPTRSETMPTPIVTAGLPHAAMMGSADPFADDDEDSRAQIARNMRGDRAEWTPTQQYLYSESALSHSSTGLAPIPYSGSRSGHSSPRDSPASSSMNHSTSRQHFDVVADPALLKAYSALAYTDEVDDALHEAGPPAERYGPDRRIREGGAMKGGSWGSWRGWLNVGAVSVLGGGLIALFAGLPVYTAFTKASLSNFGASGIGGTNSSGQVPDIAGFRGLIDSDTPDSALTRTGWDGKPYQLVFSDEFETDGRLFEPGMDPYWTAVDLHYWQTVNIEWYDPDSVTTKNGALEISLTKETNATSHGRGYLGGMIQSWNQFCFTGGYIEVAISLPGDTKTLGLWPAAWTMSNLGRAGYGGSLDGTWPYTYDACDVGTLKNQSDPNTGLPKVVNGTGDIYNEGKLSYLGGQRFSACTCPGENHPGPIKPDGTFGGRGASEIDIFEATITDGVGQISMSGQWAPFNPSYTYVNSSVNNVEFFENEYNTKANSYLGGAYQQVTSGLAETDPTTYNSTTNFNTYGFEYQPSYVEGWGTGVITWVQGGKRMWRISDTAMQANAAAQVSERGVTGEPMYALFNLGMSSNFGYVDLEHLVFPSVMRIDYVRVYQPTDRINIGCDPAHAPTAEYIKNNPRLYNDANITVLADAGMVPPKNRLIDTC